MGSVASFLANFTEGLTGGLKEHHLEQKRLEAKQAEQQLQTLQFAANHAAQLGDTSAYGNILKQIADFTSTGTGKGSKGKKDNILHQFADMLENGVPATQDPSQQTPMQPTAGAGQSAPSLVPHALPQAQTGAMTFNAEGQPELEQIRPRLALVPKTSEQGVAELGQQQSQVTGQPYEGTGTSTSRPALVRKPLFMSEDERYAKELKRFEQKKTIESDLIEKREAAKTKAKRDEVMLRIQGSKDVASLRNTAAANKKVDELAIANARAYGRTTPNEYDYDIAGTTLINTAVANETKINEQVNKIRQDVADAPKKLALMQQRVNNALTLGTQRNAIAAGQLGLSRDKFAYQQQVGDQLKASMGEYSKLTTRLNEVNKDIAVATGKGDEVAREEGIREALELKTRMGQIEGQIEQGLGSFQPAEQPNVQVTPPQGQMVDIGGRQFKVGSIQEYKGKRYRVEANGTLTQL